MGQFEIGLRKFAEKTELKINDVVRKIGLEVYSSVVMRSPVDTGRFRGNWNVSLANFDPSVSELTDKEGAASIANATVSIAEYKGGSIYISNNLPYAQVLEYGKYGTGASATVKTTRDGYSIQAPYGMVRITVVEFQEMVNKVVNSV